MTVVEMWKMRDKQDQQRRGRIDGAIRSVADRGAVEENRALAPETSYEASLERAFDWTLNQLERIQRMRKGQVVPPPIKLDVSS
jgi:hypothetical protein